MRSYEKVEVGYTIKRRMPWLQQFYVKVDQQASATLTCFKLLSVIF
jgi:hypothetical protein